MAELNEQQARFAVEYASNGAHATNAALAAGYSPNHPADIARQLLQKPHVQEAIIRELIRLRTRSGAIGLFALVSIAQNEKAPAAARVAAARTLCEHAGLVGSSKEIRNERDRVAYGDNVVDFKDMLRQIAQARNGTTG